VSYALKCAAGRDAIATAGVHRNFIWPLCFMVAQAVPAQHRRQPNRGWTDCGEPV